MKVLLLSTIVLLSFIGCNKDEVKPQPVDCVESLSPCLGDCGEGKGIQHYVVLAPAQNGGKACAHEGQAVACTASVCAPVTDGVFCPGGDFSPQCPFNPNLDVKRDCKIGEPIQCSSGVRYECKKACNSK